MQINDFNWKIGGQAGFGIMSSGMMFAKACTRAGLNIHDYSEYPSLIRGGHNTYQVYVSAVSARSQRRVVNLLVALNTKTIQEHMAELIPGSGIICDTTRVQVDELKIKKAKVQLYNVPLNEIAKQVGGDEVMRNTVALGATMALVKYPLEKLASIITEQFAHKDKSIVEQNIKAAASGYDYIKSHYKIDEFAFALKEKIQKPSMVVTANDAISLGALVAGCKFYVAYPMTPASSILHTLAELGPERGMVVRHAEDEISVINMAQGAASTGVRTMLGTSGGGWALMNEGYSLGGITETPFVVIMSMRPGPATGLPTWTEQGDLKFVINSGHGEFPRVVLTPGDQAEAFTQTVLAFNLSDIIQSPVIVLVDKYLSESHASCPYFDMKKIILNRGKILSSSEVKKIGDSYQRYQLTRDGISPRVVYGQGAYVFINSDEHNEFGFSEESAVNRIAQADKRARKLETIKKLLPKARLYGPQTASLTLVGWGSVKGPILDALQSKNLKKKVNFVHFPIVSPLPANSFSILKNFKKLVLVENNSQGQFADILRAETGLNITNKILRYDGRPFYEDELVAKLNKL
jgi:2-oxoglutarate ferredoxin oxidoreductase subunit alpha